MILEFAVLGSGSSGNCAVVTYGETRILVDAGISAKQIQTRLQEVGIDPDSLTAILLTHEHGDHVQGLEVFLRKRKTPVYATVHTSHIVQQDRIKKAGQEIAWRKFQAGSSFEIGDLTIETFNVPHDAIDPVGFVFEAPNDGGRVGVLSDVGHVTRLIVERLQGLDSLFVESNYDDIMLQEDDRRPWSLKQRISNRHGHLSNKQTAELLKEVGTPSLRHVVLGHLSSDCNTADKAKESAREALAEMGLTDVEIACAERKNPTPMLAAVKGQSAPTLVARDPELDSEIAEAVATVEEQLKTTPAPAVAAIIAEAKNVPETAPPSVEKEERPVTIPPAAQPAADVPHFPGVGASMFAGPADSSPSVQTLEELAAAAISDKKSQAERAPRAKVQATTSADSESAVQMELSL